MKILTFTFGLCNLLTKSKKTVETDSLFIFYLRQFLINCSKIQISNIFID